MMRTAFFDGIRFRPAWLGVVLATVLGVWLSFGGVSAFAAAEPHPKIGEFGSFSNPNGIAVDESNGDVYVADIGTDTVYKFDENGKAVNFTCGAQCSAYLGGNGITGVPTGSFSFPSSLPHTPAAIAVDNSTSPLDPSRGDLYVMDAGHGVIDKFSPSGEYLSQITGFPAATGSANHELLGLGVDAAGTLHVDLNRNEFGEEPTLAVDEFDDSPRNNLVAEQLKEVTTAKFSGAPETAPGADGFAVGATGDDYTLFGSCSCVVKFGQQLAGLGRIDAAGSGDVALAADSGSDHIYIDDQSSVSEWDIGAMNGSPEYQGSSEGEAVGTLVSSFGALQLSGSSGQGGIAVDGATGNIYVSNPADGRVYVFGSDAPEVVAGASSAVTEHSATLNGAIDPRGTAVNSCEFEFGLADEFGRSNYGQSVPCKPSAAALGSGSSAVPVSAQLEGLEVGKLYRFRLKASSAAGAGESAGLLATSASAFAIEEFEVSFLNEDGTADTQAGSHPYQMVTTIEFASHYQRSEAIAESPYVRLPNGTLKDLAVDLPPGLVGDPNATPKKCTAEELNIQTEVIGFPGGCPPESLVGHLQVEYSEHVPLGKYKLNPPVFNLVTAPGVALQLGINYVFPKVIIDNGVLAGGDYPIQATIVNAPPEAAVYRSRLTIDGVVGSGATRKAFLTLPTGCHGPLRATISADSYQDPGQFASAEGVTRNSAGAPVSLTGCSKLLFPPTISVAPDSTDASTSSGLTVDVHVPQTASFNPEGLAESSLRDTKVTLPEGVAINPSGADGLEACSEGLADFEIGHGVDGSGFEEFNPEFEPGVKTPLFSPTPVESLQPGVSFCPNGSKIGTVKIKTPLLEHELEGTVYLAAQNANPFGSLVAMYMMVEDPFSGSTIKLTGEVKLTATGQIVTTFKNTPDLPFENLELHFFGGERAPLSTPSRCGTYTTTAVFMPWDGNGPVTSESSFNIEHGPGGGPCPGASLPFAPSLAGGATNVSAGAFSPFTLTMTRKDGEQNLQSVEAHLPPGLLGILSNIELCGEPQADLGECPPNSLIGETTISVGVGNQPYTVSGGKFYLTGPYNGTGPCTVGQSGCAPFGITFEVPAKAGPFDLKRNTANPAGEDPCDCVIVRGKIEVNPITAAITIVSNPPGTADAIPTSIEGIPLEIQHVNAITTRGDFQFNPTNCNKMAVTGTIHSSEGSTDTIGVPFQVTNCAVLKFQPKLVVATSGKTSRANGASLSVKLTYPKAPFGSQANIRSVKVDLPKQLPSRLTTLQKACPAKTFEANPAGCPAAAIVGHATAITPLIPVPLTGPAYFVSYGGAKFPELVVVLQGYGVTLDLHGETFISKVGITSSTFHTVPDAPVGSFELNLPQGKYSALAANGNLCKSKLAMPTAFTAQNGVEIHESTKIGVTGCPKSKKAKKAKAKKAGKHSKKRR